jgi:hypothetical protein
VYFRDITGPLGCQVFHHIIRSPGHIIGPELQKYIADSLDAFSLLGLPHATRAYDGDLLTDPLEPPGSEGPGRQNVRGHDSDSNLFGLANIR